MSGKIGRSIPQISAEQVPVVLAELHRSMAADARLDLVVVEGAVTAPGTDDGVAKRVSWSGPHEHLLDLVAGAGFVDASLRREDGAGIAELRLSAVRGRTLADVVGLGLRLLVCGLNPSIYSADRGVGFARPGNRFWPAALKAGIVSRDRDPRHALQHHGVGFTDLVKRATVSAQELTPAELVDGFGRVGRLCEWLRPAAVCFLGVTGWRTATGDRAATTGWQERSVGGSPAFVMHNPSGLNAHATIDSLARQLRDAASRPA